MLDSGTQYHVNKRLMRVIAGKYKSRKLIAPAGFETRPTADRLRETLFNIVAASVPDSVWLDLFAGTGAIGIEALSREARMAYFVESSRKAARAIGANLAALHIEEGWEIIERTAATALRMLDSQAIACDFCYLDPPYRKMGDYEQVLGFLSQSRIVGAQTLVIAEHDKHFDPGEAFGSLRRSRKVQQGDGTLSFYSRQ